MTILWRRLDRPGHEAARLLETGHGYLLEGTAVMAEDGQPCRLDYAIACDPHWRTEAVRIDGWVGDRTVSLQTEADGRQRWTVNGERRVELDGCLDVDLGFSPSTNLLPIRRLALDVGQQAPVRAAWVRFPECTVEPLDQVYERLAESTYRYSSAGGRFVALLEVNDAGIVTVYPRLWEAVVR